MYKPLLKWVGGKTQIIHNITGCFPKEINNYHEIFVGGGSVLLAMIYLQKQGEIKITGNINAYDLNENLINFYNNVKFKCTDFIELFMYYLDEYDSIKGNIINRNAVNKNEALTSKESYYYYIRNIFNNNNKNTLESAVLFLFLNKTCFRGIYRVGPNGYNVPYGHYKTTPKITKESIKNFSKIIECVNFIKNDFNESFKNIKSNDYVYLDPPYYPINKNSFIKYNLESFNEKTSVKLFELVKQLKDIKFTMSNSDSIFVKEYFNEYSIKEIIAKRAINSKNPGEKTKELIINN